MVPVVFPDSTSMWLFGLAALALLVIPGPAVLYIVFQSAEQGRRVGLASVAGVHLGTLVHVAAASAGLSALIVASSLAFSVVKYAGAATWSISGFASCSNGIRRRSSSASVNRFGGRSCAA